MRTWTKRDPVKNYFPLPNEIYQLGLSHGAIAVYGYLLRIEDRRTYQCHPSYATIGKAVGMSRNTVRKYVQELEERGLICTSAPASSRGTGASKTEVCSTRSCRSSFPSTSSTSDSWMLWTEQRNGSAWQDAWSRPACESGGYFSLRAAIMDNQNREAHQCGKRNSNGITQPSGAATPRNSDAHERIAVPQALCVFRERSRPRPKSGKVCRSDTRPRRVSEPRKTLRG